MERVLVVSSHVVCGRVGLRASLSALEMGGLEPAGVASCQLSNHLGYGVAGGEFFTRTMAEGIREGMVGNGLHREFGYVVTGFLGKVDFATAILDLVDDVVGTREEEEEGMTSSACLVADTVLGDHGKLYLSPEMVAFTREQVVPRAHVVTPNMTELCVLAGMEPDSVIDTREGVLAAIARVHDLGPEIVILTSVDPIPRQEREEPGEEEALDLFDPDQVTTLVSEKSSGRMYCVVAPRKSGRFVGTGDLFASALVAWHHRLGHQGDQGGEGEEGGEGMRWVNAAARAVGSMQRTLAVTESGGELGIVAALPTLLDQEAEFPAPRQL